MTREQATGNRGTAGAAADQKPLRVPAAVTAHGAATRARAAKATSRRAGRRARGAGGVQCACIAALIAAASRTPASTNATCGADSASRERRIISGSRSDSAM